EMEQLKHIYGHPTERFAEMVKDMGDITLYRAKEGGCERCGKSGYKGRTGIHELLVATPEMKNLIARNASIAEIRKLAINEGMTSLMQDGIWKIMKGQSDIVQLRKVVAE
ncbi:MAG: hypothetical protein WCR46_13075, partial [Deltaproteobacteria bacterium]